MAKFQDFTFHYFKLFLLVFSLIVLITGNILAQKRNSESAVTEEQEKGKLLFTADGKVILRGIIVNVTEGKPVAGALFGISEKLTTQTDSSGKFEIQVPVEKLQSGISVNKEGFELYWQELLPYNSSNMVIKLVPIPKPGQGHRLGQTGTYGCRLPGRMPSDYDNYYYPRTRAGFIVVKIIGPVFRLFNI